MQTVDVAVVGMTMDVTGSNERAASLPRLPAVMAPLRKQQPGRCRGKFFFSWRASATAACEHRDKP